LELLLDSAKDSKLTQKNRLQRMVKAGNKALVEKQTYRKQQLASDLKNYGNVLVRTMFVFLFTTA